MTERPEERRRMITREVIEWTNSDQRRSRKHINDDHIEKARRLRLFNFWRYMIPIGVGMFPHFGHVLGEITQTVGCRLDHNPGEYGREQREGDELSPRRASSPLPPASWAAHEPLCEVRGKSLDGEEA